MSSYTAPPFQFLIYIEAYRRPGEPTLDAAERWLLNEGLNECGGHQAKVAKRFRETAATISRKLLKHGMRNKLIPFKTRYREPSCP